MATTPLDYGYLVTTPIAYGYLVTTPLAYGYLVITPLAYGYLVTTPLYTRGAQSGWDLGAMVTMVTMPTTALNPNPSLPGTLTPNPSQP